MAFALIGAIFAMTPDMAVDSMERDRRERGVLTDNFILYATAVSNWANALTTAGNPVPNGPVADGNLTFVAGYLKMANWQAEVVAADNRIFAYGPVPVEQQFHVLNDDQDDGAPADQIGTVQMVGENPTLVSAMAGPVVIGGAGLPAGIPLGDFVVFFGY